MNLPLHPDIGLPIYPADTNVLVRVDEFETAQSSDDSYFVRHTGIDAPASIKLLDAIRISTAHLTKFSRRIGGSIVPHQFGLIPEKPLRDKYKKDLNENVTTFPPDMPEGYLLVARVAVIEPVTGQKDAWMSLGEKVDEVKTELHSVSPYKFYDLDETQVMLGMLKRRKGRQQPRWWLVDIEPRFTETKQITNI